MTKVVHPGSIALARKKITNPKNEKLKLLLCDLYTHTQAGRLLPTRSIVCQMEGRTGCTCTRSLPSSTVWIPIYLRCVFCPASWYIVVVRISFIFIYFYSVRLLFVLLKFLFVREWDAMTNRDDLGGDFVCGCSQSNVKRYAHVCVCVRLYGDMCRWG